MVFEWEERESSPKIWDIGEKPIENGKHIGAILVGPWKMGIFGLKRERREYFDLKNWQKGIKAENIVHICVTLLTLVSVHTSTKEWWERKPDRGSYALQRILKLLRVWNCFRR